MESFGHKMIISSQPVPLTGTGVLYPRVRDFFFPTKTRQARQEMQTVNYLVLPTCGTKSSWNLTHLYVLLVIPLDNMFAVVFGKFK